MNFGPHRQADATRQTSPVSRTDRRPQADPELRTDARRWASQDRWAGWLPGLRFGPDRWWLPLSRGSSDLLASAMLTAADGSPASGTSSGCRGAVIERLRSDPTLLIFAALASRGDDETDTNAVALVELADWLLTDGLARFADVDAFLGGPQWADELSEPLEARWRELDAYFRSLPTGHWVAQASLWLESAGPPVPPAWRHRWPAIDLAPDEEADPDGEPAVSAVDAGSLPLLPRLARQLRRTQVWEASFRETLHHEKLESLRQLAYGLSHEINNPLANISTRAQQLQRDEESAERVEGLRRIVDQVYRAHSMIADLMFFANPPAVRPETFDLVELASESADRWRGETERLGIELRRALPAHRLVVTADRKMIHESIGVLLRNAVEAVGSDGAIGIEAGRDGSTAWVRVTDSGPGLSDEARRHAFDPYYSGREAGRGLGLGLCRAYRIACLHEGDITLGGGLVGCVATLRIPARGSAGHGDWAERDSGGRV